MRHLLNLIFEVGEDASRHHNDFRLAGASQRYTETAAVAGRAGVSRPDKVDDDQVCLRVLRCVDCPDLDVLPLAAGESALADVLI
jgi:hypothetical protein